MKPKWWPQCSIVCISPLSVVSHIHAGDKGSPMASCILPSNDYHPIQLCNRLWVGVTKTPCINFSINKYISFPKVSIRLTESYSYWLLYVWCSSMLYALLCFIMTIDHAIVRPHCIYRQTCNISHTLVGNKNVDHSGVVGAAPVGAAPTTSSFLT